MNFTSLTRALIGASALVAILGCSDDPDSGSKKPSPGKYTDYSDRTAKITIGNEIEQKEFYRNQEMATAKYCKDGTNSLDPQVTAGILSQVRITSVSSLRTQNLLENRSFGFFEPNQFQYNVVLLKSEISDYHGAVASTQPMTTLSCKKTAQNGHSTTTCGDFKVNWTQEYVQYLMKRTPEADETSASGHISIVPVPNTHHYYNVRMTTASGIQLEAYRVDSVQKMTVSDANESDKVYRIETQAFYTADTMSLSPPGYFCQGLNQVLKINRIYDLQNRLVKTNTEEVLDAPVRASNPQ